MRDLFGLSLVPGFNQKAAILTAEEEAGLIARIDGVDLSPFRFQGWTGKRLTRSFGCLRRFGATLDLPSGRRGAA